MDADKLWVRNRRIILTFDYVKHLKEKSSFFFSSRPTFEIVSVILFRQEIKESNYFFYDCSEKVDHLWATKIERIPKNYVLRGLDH